MLSKILRHFHTVNKHRWEVFKLCVKVGIPFQGLVHDLSKYSFEEFFETASYYKNGEFSPISTCKKEKGYSRAWLHHFGRNKHHYEYWYDYAAPVKTPIIPFKYMLEMVCDRIAASKTYNKKNYDLSYELKYFYHEKDTMVLNDKLKNFLEIVFTELSKKGESILKKKYLKKVYDKCINE